MPLTPKQESFVEEYLIALDATQAAIRAGYSKKTAHVIGPENLGKTCNRRCGFKGARGPDRTHQNYARLRAGKHFLSHGTLQAS
jgi:hypothetical protein